MTQLKTHFSNYVEVYDRVDDSMYVHFVNLSKISLVFKILASFNNIIVLSINSYLTQLSQYIFLWRNFIIIN